MAQVYRKLYTRLWRHESFHRLTDGERVLALYLLSGPQTNQIGCYHFSPALACEDLRVSPPQLQKRMEAVCGAFSWQWRKGDHLFYVPSWLKWNRPNGGKVMKGWRESVDDVPNEQLRNAIATALESQSNGDRTAIERRSNGDRTQEQEQEQEQDLPPNPPPSGGRRLTAGELQDARKHIAVIGGCPHGLTHSVGECARLVALKWRGEAVPA